MMSGVWDWAGLWWKDGRRGGEGEGRAGAMGMRWQSQLINPQCPCVQRGLL